MFFSFHQLGSVQWAQDFQKICLQVDGDAGKATPCSTTMSAFANGGVSVLVRASRRGDGAQGCSAYSSADTRDFLRTQRTGAPANQYSVLVIHTFISFHLWAHATSPSLSKKPFAWAANGRRIQELAVTNRRISIRAA